MSALELRTISDRRSEPDDAGLGLLTARSCDCVVNPVQVANEIGQPKRADSEAAHYLSPSSTTSTCQPYDKNRWVTSSVNATAVSPSMVISVQKGSETLKRAIQIPVLTVVVVNLRMDMSTVKRSHECEMNAQQ